MDKIPTLRPYKHNLKKIAEGLIRLQRSGIPRPLMTLPPLVLIFKTRRNLPFSPVFIIDGWRFSSHDFRNDHGWEGKRPVSIYTAEKYTFVLVDDRKWKSFLHRVRSSETEYDRSVRMFLGEIPVEFLESSDLYTIFTRKWIRSVMDGWGQLILHRTGMWWWRKEYSVSDMLDAMRTNKKVWRDFASRMTWSDKETKFFKKLVPSDN